MSVGISSDGSTAISGSRDNKAKIVDVKTGTPLATIEHDAQVTSVGISSDGSTAISGSRDNKAKIVDVKTGTPLATIEHDAQVTSVGISSDGSIAISSSSLSSILVNLKTGEFINIFSGDNIVKLDELAFNIIVGRIYGKKSEIIRLKNK